jgi:uncharacterized membrane protein
MASQRAARRAKQELARELELAKAREEELQSKLASQGGSVGTELMAFKAEIYRGLLPHPDILERFENINPGMTDRLLVMAEKQQDHRHELEKTVVFGGATRAKNGLIAGVFIAVLFLAVSAWLIFTGHDIAGTVLGSVDLVALVTVFVVGRDSQKRERVEKAKIREDAKAAIDPGNAYVTGRGAKGSRRG